jgi:vitamin B12 transporter
MTAPKTLAAAWLALSGSGLLQAGESDVIELTPRLVVTPSRMVQPLTDTLAAVTVISREDIELSAAEDLFELLRLQPGVDVVRTGGAGAQTSVFLRGSNSNHVLVLVDGVRVGSANTGAYAWEQLPLNQIERVEIVRGPRGSLYGSDAIGGVVHVFTRSAPEPHARVTGGSFGTAEAEGGLGYQGERTRLSINAGYRNVDGFSAQNPNGFSYHPDDDGFEGVSLGVNGATEATVGDWEYSVLAMDSRSEFDQGHSDARQVIAALGFSSRVSADWAYQVRGGYVRDDLFTDFEFYSTDFQSRRYEASWQNQLRLAAGGLLSFGLDHYQESGHSAGSWDESRRNNGVFGSYDHARGRLHLQLGGRYDENSRFGGEFTGQIAGGYDLSDSWKVIGSYGTAFRGPNLSEQFSPGFGGFFAGNPDLEPESSRSAEAGFRWRHGSLGRLTLSLYRTEIDDLIAFNGEFFQAINIERARLEGLEIDYDLSWQGWNLRANTTLQNAENRSTGEDLLRRPERKAALVVDRRFDNGSWIGFEWIYSGRRWDFGGIELDSYRLLNLRAGWTPVPAWRLELRGENLADETYEPAYGFNGAGRSWFLSVAWVP